MNITLWGVRGSIATSGPEFARIGGNTTCVEIEQDGVRLIVDAGTGVRALGDKLAEEARALGRSVEAAFLFSHLHWDHIQGFPFFRPAYLPETVLRLYGPVHEDGSSLEEVLMRQMQPPTFPVPIAAMPSRRSFETLRPGAELEIGPFRIVTRALCHPQGALGFRVEAGRRSLCFATDTEHPPDGSLDEGLLSLARDVDLLIHDAQYTDAEYRGLGGSGPPRIGWGHSTYGTATRAARSAGARQLLLFHHDPAHHDDLVEAIERDARGAFENTRAARQGDRYSLGQ